MNELSFPNYTTGLEFIQELGKKILWHNNHFARVPYNQKHEKVLRTLTIDPLYLHYLLEKVKSLDKAKFQFYSTDLNQVVGYFMVCTLYDLKIRPIENVKEKNIFNIELQDVSIDLGFCEHLRELSLISLHPKYIKGFSDGVIQQLEKLTINHSISSVSEAYSYNDQHPLPYLLTLDLSFNKIKSLDATEFKAFLNLKTLNLSNNQLKYFPCIYLLHLESFDLSNNELSLLELDAKFGYSSLKVLKLGYNKLSSAAFLVNLPSLKVLNLEKNLIWNLNELKLILTSSNLENLNIEGNPMTLHSNYFDIVKSHKGGTKIEDGKQKIKFFMDSLFSVFRMPKEKSSDTSLKEDKKLNTSDSSFPLALPRDKNQSTPPLRSPNFSTKSSKEENDKSSSKDSLKNVSSKGETTSFSDRASIKSARKRNTKTVKITDVTRKRDEESKTLQFSTLPAHLGDDDILHYKRHVESLKYQSGTLWSKVYTENEKAIAEENRKGKMRETAEKKKHQRVNSVTFEDNKENIEGAAKKQADSDSLEIQQAQPEIETLPSRHAESRVEENLADNTSSNENHKTSNDDEGSTPASVSQDIPVLYMPSFIKKPILQSSLENMSPSLLLDLQLNLYKTDDERTISFFPIHLHKKGKEMPGYLILSNKTIYLLKSKATGNSKNSQSMRFKDFKIQELYSLQQIKQINVSFFRQFLILNNTDDDQQQSVVKVNHQHYCTEFIDEVIYLLLEHNRNVRKILNQQIDWMIKCFYIFCQNNSIEVRDWYEKKYDNENEQVSKTELSIKAFTWNPLVLKAYFQLFLNCAPICLICTFDDFIVATEDFSSIKTGKFFNKVLIKKIRKLTKILVHDELFLDFYFSDEEQGTDYTFENVECPSIYQMTTLFESLHHLFVAQCEKNLASIIHNK